VNRSIPVIIFDLIEGSKIALHSFLKLAKILLFISVGVRNTREIEGEVFSLESLLSPVQGLMNLLFFRNLTGQEGKKSEQKDGKEPSHFAFSTSPPG